MSFVAILFLGGFLLIIGFSISLFWNFKRIGKIFSLLQIATLIFGTFLLLTGFLLLDSVYALQQVGSDNYTKLGPYGDYIGGMLNPLIALFAVIAAGFAFYAQYQANKQVQDQFRSQQFESQFFEMLRLHKENVNEMKISGYGILLSNTIETGSGKIIETITRTQIERPVEGRKVFVSMKKEFIACCNFCILYNKQLDDKYTINQILELAYKIFFFSSTSDSIYCKGIDRQFILDVKNKLKLVRETHRDSSGQINVFPGLKNDKITLHIKYSPFTGHESRLGHYYRHLYSTVKYVVKNENDGLFNYKKSREYLKLLRSQMSNDEQKMLYYNYIVGFGANWDRLGDEGNKFLTHYRMLHNLPLDNIKHVEDPRKHFEEFIKSIKNPKDPMFEWGDSINKS